MKNSEMGPFSYFKAFNVLRSYLLSTTYQILSLVKICYFNAFSQAAPPYFQVLSKIPAICSDLQIHKSFLEVDNVWNNISCENAHL